MSVLRENKESLMAVLEAFVYDPLINWRLMQADVDSRRPEGVIHFVVIRLNLYEEQTPNLILFVPLNLLKFRVIPKVQLASCALMRTISSMVKLSVCPQSES